MESNAHPQETVQSRWNMRDDFPVLRGKLVAGMQYATIKRTESASPLRFATPAGALPARWLHAEQLRGFGVTLAAIVLDEQAVEHRVGRGDGREQCRT